jgi:hypothetical protein
LKAEWISVLPVEDDPGDVLPMKIGPQRRDRLDAVDQACSTGAACATGSSASKRASTASIATGLPVKAP